MGKKGGKQSKKEEGGLTRIAIVNADKCKPKKCRQECKKFCPVVRMGKICIEVTPKSKEAWISEELCIGCGICVKKCPFDAITIINLPKNLEAETTHRYGANAFKLHRLPMPRPGQVLGLVGANGTGKSTAMKILAGKLKPNLGRFDSTPDWADILTYFRGSELQNYFTRVIEDTMRTSMKPQYVDHIPRAVKGSVGEILKRKDQRDATKTVGDELELTKLIDHDIANLSGGELQRFAIAVVCVQECDVYMFDEPSSYLDVEQRLAAARVIRSLLNVNQGTYVIVIEHDLAVLDYLSDFVCCLYGKPGAYGVVTMPYGVREGINVFLAGFVPTENLRFRDEALTFKVAERADDSAVATTADGKEAKKKHRMYAYPTMTKTLGSFTLNVQEGGFSDSEIIVLLGQNGTGKCLARGTPVLAHNGRFVRVEDIVAGDKIMGDDNTPRVVQSTTTGRESMARIKRRGAAQELFTCNVSHVLTLQASRDVARVHRAADGAHVAEWLEQRVDERSITTRIVAQRATFRSERAARAHLSALMAASDASAVVRAGAVIDIAVRDFVPLSAAVRELFRGFTAPAMDFAGAAAAEQLPVDPYALGLCIGRSAHDESESTRGAAGDALARLMRGADVRVPDAYKTASRDARARLLAGVLDARGRVDASGARYELHALADGVARDIAFVARSLGLVVADSGAATGKRGGAACVRIGGRGLASLPTLARAPSGVADADNTFALDIELLPEDEYFGFTLDGNGRFVVGEQCVVTHNTTLIRMLAGLLKPDDEEIEVPELNVSYKPQKISPKFPGTVRQLLHKKIRDTFMHPQFNTDVSKPLQLEPLLDQEVVNLSGGELQRVALVLALGQPADIYLIDEPSAYLDSEQRVVAAKVIKRFIMHAQKTGFIVEHDFIMATYLADRVVVYEGTPSVNCTATTPQPLLSGMNKFLEMLEITFRRDPTNFRPRINKLDSQMDQQQKAAGEFFFVDEGEPDED